jgi:hypothetical protein
MLILFVLLVLQLFLIFQGGEHHWVNIGAIVATLLAMFIMKD